MKRPGRVRASLTVEAAFVFSVIFFAISTMFTFAFRQRDLTLGGYLANEASCRAARIEARYDPEGLTEEKVREDLKERASNAGSLSSAEAGADRGILNATASLDHKDYQLSAETRIFDPEGTMRLYTSLGEFLQTNKYRKGNVNDASNTE